MVSDALARDRRIAMIQPQTAEEGAPLFRMGCVGKIVDVEAMEDGRYNIVLEGLSRFRILRELEVKTPFRQVEAELIDEPDDLLSAIERAGFELEARTFATAQGYSVDWDSVGRLDDAALINGVSQIAPSTSPPSRPARSARLAQPLRVADPADAILRPPRPRRRQVTLQ
jgi:Lon protease-like protein